MMNGMVNDTIARLLGPWSADLNVYSILLRLAVSVAMAAAIGCERSSKRHSAGLRTFILVALGAASAMLADCSLMAANGSNFPIISAATMIGAAVISGNAILFTSKNQIKGLTTSAALWVCGLLGIAAGAGLYTVTLIAFFALFFSISLLPAFEKYLKDRSNHFEIHLELKNREDLPSFIATVRKLGIRIDDLESNPAYLRTGLSVYTVALTVDSDTLRKYKKHNEIIEALRSLEYVYHIEEMS